MNYDQAVRYLLTLGRELASPQHARAAKFDLQNISALTERLNHPERAYPTIHVAGTNGKGSTAAMLASTLEAAGLRTGLYTSPHLVRINERMRLGGVEISDAEFAAVFKRVHDVIEELLASGQIAAHPTYFECVTAMAFVYFAEQRAEFAVFEVGMGGRLDSTNVIEPQIAIITQIAFDHENFLGHSIEQIASEKAGIIKPGAWVVNAATQPAANEVVRQKAQAQGARLLDIDSAWSVSDLRSEGGRYRFSAQIKPEAWTAAASPDELQVELPLAGRYQIRNALTAMTAARLLFERGFPVDDAAIARGLAQVRWPGRLELVRERPTMYLDGTHNSAGARELLNFWDEQLAGRKIHLVYGAMRDKAVDEFAGLLFPRAATVTVTQSRQPRSISAQALAAMTAHLSPHIEAVPDPGAALERALELADPDDVVFITGSLYLVGDLRTQCDRHRQPQDSNKALSGAGQSPKPA